MGRSGPNQRWRLPSAHALCCFATNLPLSSNPESENVSKEALQGYTEVDSEIWQPKLINRDTYYFLDLSWDSEKSSGFGAPDFYSEIEWLNRTGSDGDPEVPSVSWSQPTGLHATVAD
jgi:hypothetical protein